MIVFGTDINLNLLTQYIKEKKDFYIFDYELCEMEIRLLKSFSIEEDGDKTVLKLVFKNLGKPDIQHSIYSEGTAVSMGLPDKLTLYENREECISNLETNFLIKVMKAEKEPNHTTGENIDIERIARWYRFKKTHLTSWIEEFPQIIL